MPPGDPPGEPPPLPPRPLRPRPRPPSLGELRLLAGEGGRGLRRGRFGRIVGRVAGPPAVEGPLPAKSYKCRSEML